MWAELVCGVVLYRLVKRFFWQDDAVSNLDSAHFNSLFAVAQRFEKLYHGCKVYVGLQIPDPDSASRKNIDLVLVTNHKKENGKSQLLDLVYLEKEKKAVVISVQNNILGFVSIDKENQWLCTDITTQKTEIFPDPVGETKQLVSILEEYLEQRGVVLPEGYMSFKVICPSPSFPAHNLDAFPHEVITYEQWKKLKPEQRSLYSNWIKGSFFTGKKKVQESFCDNLNSVLSTAPIWDRLELKDNKYILGEFIEFKGKSDDLNSLRKIKRSKVSHLAVHTTSMFGFASSTVIVRFTPRDYRAQGPSWSSHWQEITVSSSSEVLFQPQNSKKPFKYKLSSVVSVVLSA
ncbi:hypothetical protein STAS_23845 [Striga asiatica]|uniref:NERD domain-containing protein n=1 Tax=Striga asiatica TaxID=4170 RepID=A0A5A7QP00_STRAF|nr:hypothetical protein STAS_23845 [Striga asiatica]